MSFFYLTNSLLYNFKDKNYYYKNSENSEPSKINCDNWEYAVKEYGWCDFEYEIEDILGTKFKMLECGGGGDCFFHCLSEAINLNLIYLNNSDDFFSIENVRSDVANMINKGNFDFIIQNYLIECENGEFQGDWDPTKIDSVSELQNEIKKCGDNFWADDVIISLISKCYKINFIVINTPDNDDNISVIRLSSNYYKNIIIYYDMACHYKLVGYFDGKKIKTIFTNNDIPEEVIKALTFK